MSQPPMECYFTTLLNSNPQRYSSSPNQSNPSTPSSQNSNSSSQPYPPFGKQMTPDQAYQQQLAYHQHQQQSGFQNLQNPRNTSPEENEADHIENAKNIYRERYGNKKFQYVHSWNILKSYPKWDAAKPIDEDNLAKLFGPDPRARPADKPRPAKKAKSVETSSAGRSTRGSTGRSQSESITGFYLRIIEANVKLPKPHTR
nr:myb-like domain, Myb/SANT-like DNA-binding domain protein [Tanacetum cinerariifolium]